MQPPPNARSGDGGADARYDLDVVDEAIVNAVAHRDYAISGSKIRLFLFADQLELYSPGKLPNTITPDEMPYRTFTRNQLLVSFCPESGASGPGRCSRGEQVRKILQDGDAHSERRPTYELFGDELRLSVMGEELNANRLRGGRVSDHRRSLCGLAGVHQLRLEVRLTRSCVNVAPCAPVNSSNQRRSASAGRAVRNAAVNSGWRLDFQGDVLDDDPNTRFLDPHSGSSRADPRRSPSTNNTCPHFDSSFDEPLAEALGPRTRCMIR